MAKDPDLRTGKVLLLAWALTLSVEELLMHLLHDANIITATTANAINILNFSFHLFTLRINFHNGTKFYTLVTDIVT